MMKSVTMSTKTHTKSLQPFHFENVLRRKKTVEARLNKSEYGYQQGDHIDWTCVNNTKKLHTIVEDLRVYPNFRTMLEQEGIRNVLPGVSSMEEALQVYLKSDTNPDGLYTTKDEQELGVLAIKLKYLGWGSAT